jgi:mRNA interferase RelE/StbE
MNRYTVSVTPQAWKEIKSLQGNMRQRVKRAVDALATDPRPPRSTRLAAPELLPELFRLRLERWRIVYAISDRESAVDVLAVRRRPPYDHGDLETLAADIV